MGVLDLWTDQQRAMSGFGRTLTDAEAETTCPACPAWTVREVYAHQAGLVADLLAGRLEGITTEPWTQRQVDERADRSLPEILDEWDAGAPKLVEALSPLGVRVDPRLVIDVWHHHQDVRSALGRPEPLSEAGHWAVAVTAANLAERLDERGLPPLAVELDEGPPAVPDAEVRVRVPAFEYVRATVGRRSRAQVRAWDWDGDDVDAYVDLIPVFAFRADDLEEPRP